jgi:hypothetical protein
MGMTRTMSTENTEADLARSVEVGIETTTAVVSGQAFHGWRFDRIGEIYFGPELEEAELVRCIRRTNDEAAHSTDVVLEVCDGKC